MTHIEQIAAMRDATGLPLMECKKRLAEVAYDLKKAIKIATGQPIYIGRLRNTISSQSRTEILSDVNKYKAAVQSVLDLEKRMDLSAWIGELLYPAGFSHPAGEPVTQEMVDDPGVQYCIKNGLLELVQPYEKHPPYIPGASVDGWTDEDGEYHSV